MLRAFIILACCLMATGPAAAQPTDHELKELTWLGFQQFHEASRVFIRTTEPVRFTVDTSRPEMVVLILENTRIGAQNNQRHLDTRHFDGPVRMIWPRVIEGPSQSVRIEIYLRDKVPFKEIQNDTFLALDFRR